MTELYTISVSGLDWRARLNDISDARRAAALRYRNENDIRRSVGAGLLLAARFGRDAAIDRSETGKPFFPGEGKVHFSISHSGEYAVLAVSKSPVGVDIERDRCTMSIARRFFTRLEAAFLDELSEGVRGYYLHRLWTVKEAYLKMTGAGLSGGMDSFEVTFINGRAYIPGVKIMEQQLGEYRIAVCERL